MPNFVPIWLSFILLMMAVSFVWNGLKGLRTGGARIPLRLIADDEFERGTTMYGLAIVFNFLGAIGALSILIWLIVTLK